MTITLMLLLSNSHLLASGLCLRGVDPEPSSGFVTAKAAQVPEPVRAYDLREAADGLPHAL